MMQLLAIAYDTACGKTVEVQHAEEDKHTKRHQLESVMRFPAKFKRHPNLRMNTWHCTQTHAAGCIPVWAGWRGVAYDRRPWRKKTIPPGAVSYRGR